MAVKFLNRLKKHRQDLYIKATELNKRDEYIIQDNKFLNRKRNDSTSSDSSSSSSYSSDDSSSNYSD